MMMRKTDVSRLSLSNVGRVCVPVLYYACTGRARVPLRTRFHRDCVIILLLQYHHRRYCAVHGYYCYYYADDDDEADETIIVNRLLRRDVIYIIRIYTFSAKDTTLSAAPDYRRRIAIYQNAFGQRLGGVAFVQVS